MGTIDHIQCIGLSIPMFSALTCLFMLFMFRRRNGDKTQRQLSILMILTYAMAVCCWLGIILYIVDYDGFIWFNALVFLALMLDQVLLYRFVFSVTGTGSGRKFSMVHYIIPVALAAVLSVWSLFVPYEVQYHIVETRGEIAPGWEWYSRFFLAGIPIFIIYNIIYPLLGLLRVRAYRKAVVNYSADEQRASARWLYGLVFLIWLTLPFASSILFVHRSELFASRLTVPGAFLPIFQYLFICYNLMAGNYIIIQSPEPEDSVARGGRPKNIDRRKFEAYIKDKKPYLNPKLKITDMCVEMGTNRSYLSSFINSEYGMNFSRYINLRRLAELDRIRIAPENKNALGVEMVLEAGFSSYRSYMRIKDDEDAQRTVGF